MKKQQTQGSRQSELLKLRKYDARACVHSSARRSRWEGNDVVCVGVWGVRARETGNPAIPPLLLLPFTAHH